MEVNRGDRRTRRAAGKSDTVDAEVAARSVLAGQSTAIPKTADGAVEMMRQLKITRDTAVKARTTAMNTLKQIVVHAPPVLREALHALTDHGLLTRCAGLRPGPLDTLTASAKHTLRALARRWMALTEEIHVARYTTSTSRASRPRHHRPSVRASVWAPTDTVDAPRPDGAVEMMRQLKITRDTAVKARTTAMNTLKQIVVHAPPRLREALHALTDHGLLTRCAGLRPGPLDTLTASAKHTLRALARRWMALTDEIAIHDQHLARLTTETSPTLREGFGVGAHTAAELLIVFGDNPDRIRSDAAFAKLCGACPIPASSGMTTGRHRLNRGGHRQANAALYRAVIVRMRFHQPTRDYVARRTADGRTKREIIRCLKRFLAREIYQRVMTDFRTRQAVTQAA